jgi:hypothetical protein
LLDEFIFLIQCHVVNVVIEFAVPASVASPVTSVTGQCGWVFCLGAVDVSGFDWG